ncbi:hypothetical protein JOQ06_003215 [Pogonophryne albipinna]|uniref:Uncharacterized protein n=1 Tax=Pogonophryne albipinna TaxID=1090488 RepID=A0AAD6B5V4_9TELE|nr:hypothetical protein JOQ06_003215 [Pogonophryne albipinna]
MPVKLTITLEMGPGKTTILEQAVDKDFYRCLNFQVPTVHHRTVASINVTITGEGVSMSKKTKILIDRPAFIHIIQTDKPIYKPGQKARLYKVVELQDPNSIRIA